MTWASSEFALIIANTFESSSYLPFNNSNTFECPIYQSYTLWKTYYCTTQTFIFSNKINQSRLESIETAAGDRWISISNQIRWTVSLKNNFLFCTFPLFPAMENWICILRSMCQEFSFLTLTYFISS